MKLIDELKRENKQVLINIILDLCYLDKKNEERLKEIYNKYR